MLKGKNVSLRTVREADLTELYRLQSDVALRDAHLSPLLTSETQFQQEFRETGLLNRERGLLLLTDLEDRILGTVMYFSVNYMDGFELAAQVFEPAQRGRGLVTEALRMVMRYLFDSYNINRLQAATTVANEGGNRVMSKLGFTLEGVLRGHYYNRGRHEDLNLYSMLRREFHELSGQRLSVSKEECRAPGTSARA